MSAEFQLPSPLVPVRESYFARFCKQHDDGTWVVVDVSLDSVQHPGPLETSRRSPSGCVIKEMPNGYSKVNKPSQADGTLSIQLNLLFDQLLMPVE